jgi:ribonuclease-3
MTMQSTEPGDLSSKVAELEETIGYEFKDDELLQSALTHRSFRFENKDVECDNERLEFLGDAILGFLAAAYLYETFVEHAEGTLTSLRSRVTSGSALAEYAAGVKLGACLRMGQGEDRSGGRSRRSNLANAFEALVGAAYLDGGMAAAETIFSRLIVPHLTAEDVDAWTANPKGRLQEYSQSHWKRSPTYRVIGSEGPPHNTRFTVQVTLEDGSFSIASGNSKQEAQSRAAGDLLTRMEAEAESE